MKYIFVTKAEISMVTSVEADNLEKAVLEARDRGVIEICEQCLQRTKEYHNIMWTPEGGLDCDSSGMELVDLHVEGSSLGEKLFEEAYDLWEETFTEENLWKRKKL